MGSLWVVVDRCGSLWVVVGRCGSLWVVPGFSNYVCCAQLILYLSINIIFSFIFSIHCHTQKEQKIIN